MSASAVSTEAPAIQSGGDFIRHAALAPRPARLPDTGLDLPFVADLLGKHLETAGVLRMSQLVERLALAGPIVEQVLLFMRKDGRVEVRGRLAHEPELCFGLTDRGRAAALDALSRGGYVGPAPVPLAAYGEIVRRQTVHARRVTQALMREKFAGVVLPEGVLDRLGTALNSGRAIFVYGPAGTGKTYVSQQLNRVIDSSVLVPHGVLVGDTVVQVFDLQAHRPVERGGADPARLSEGFDPRYACCRRPLVVTGGELTLDVLEVHFESATRTHVAPPQMRANNGVFVVDDLGRQRVTAEALFNRWIVPMEERIDHLTLANGRRFTVPFDVVLVFSTNLEPHDVADDAFLRRLGYKIAFLPIAAGQYRSIWEARCREIGIEFNPALVDFVIGELHGPSATPLLPCHPRDLIGMALDHRAYAGLEPALTEQGLLWAWSNYFVDSRFERAGGS